MNEYPCSISTISAHPVYKAITPQTIPIPPPIFVTIWDLENSPIDKNRKVSVTEIGIENSVNKSYWIHNLQSISLMKESLYQLF